MSAENTQAAGTAGELAATGAPNGLVTTLVAALAMLAAGVALIVMTLRRRSTGQH